MGVDIFTSLGNPLNSTEPEYFWHVLSVFLLYLRYCARNYPFMNRTSPTFEFMIVMVSWGNTIIALSISSKKMILTSGSVPDQVTIYPPLSLYDLLHRVASNLSPVPYTSSVQLIITTVHIYISPSGY